MKTELTLKTNKKKFKPMHWILIGGFISLFGTCVVIIATFYNNKSSSAKSDSIKNTGENTNQKVLILERQNEQLLKDNEELRIKNNTLQNKVDFLKDRNEELSSKILEANDISLKYMQGHDSYFSVTLSINNEGRAQVYLSHKGENPISDATVKIANTTLFDNGNKRYRGSLERWGVDPPNYDEREPQMLYVPKLHVGEWNHLAGEIACNRVHPSTFMITATASSGTWFERLIVWPSGPGPYPYSQSYRILKIDPENPKSNKSAPKELKIIYETSLPDYLPDKKTFDWYGHNWF